MPEGGAVGGQDLNEIFKAVGRTFPAAFYLSVRSQESGAAADLNIVQPRGGFDADKSSHQGEDQVV